MACNKEFIVHIVAESLCRHVWSSLHKGIFPNPLGSSVVKIFLMIDHMSFMPLSEFVGERVILIFPQQLLSGSVLLAGLKVLH